MRTYRIDLQYIGVDFNGWQSQPDGSGIQDYIEKALSTILGEPLRVTGASRTDSGVHAEHQVCSLRVERTLDCDKVRLGLQALLPKTIGIKTIQEVGSEFHPIMGAKAKAYRYRLWRASQRDPFLEPYVYRVSPRIDLDRIRDACACLIGEHDFSSFCAVDSGAKTKIRTIYEIDLKVRGDLIEIWFLGNGFLKQMVRAMVGTVVDVGLGKITAQDIGPILAAKDRRLAGPTAPAQGLCLVRVFYDDGFRLANLLES